MELTHDTIRSADDLHTFIRNNFEVTIPRKFVTKDHAAPFDYIMHAFFEGRIPSASADDAGTPATTSPDCIIWANRGGGKTFLGALATALDLLFKPGIQVRILAGSLEQASRMHDHLRSFFERPKFKKYIQGKITDRRITLINKSRIELLAQSQASVRGTRPQKLRCDEVELFDPDVWSAAQLTTRSLRIGSLLVRGSVEAFSTMHLPHGLMSRLIAESTPQTRQVFKWGIADVLERCVEHQCGEKTEHQCPLWNECGGAAKKDTHSPGHVPIADALTLKSRVSLNVWESEMMCLRPSRTHAVVPEFTRERHVVAALPWEADGTQLSDTQPTLWLAGMDFGFRSPTVFLWAAVYEGALYIVDEHHESGMTLDNHFRAIDAKGYPRPAWVGADPAGHSRHEQTGLSNINCLQRAGLIPRTRASAILDGISLIRARLDPADGSRPRLFVHARCTKLIESLERYHYDPDRPFHDEPVKDGPDHAVDALRYLIVNQDRPYRAKVGGWA